MTQIRHMGTSLRAAPAPGEPVPGISDLLADAATGRLYDVLDGAAGVELRDLAGEVTLRDSMALEAGAGLDAPRQLLRATFDGAPVLLIHGRYGQQIEAVWLDEAGGFAAQDMLQMAGPPGALTALAVTGAGDLLASASRHQPGLTLWRRTGTDLDPVTVETADGLLGANDIAALEIVGSGAARRLLAVSAGRDSLFSFALEPDGALRDMREIGPAEGLFVDRPDRLLSLEVAGETYAVIGASGSSSLAAVALLPGGGLELRDHVADDLATRFQGVPVLEAVTLSGQAYLVAGGSDDGLSLLTLLPGGRFLHIDTLAYGEGMALNNPSALSLVAGDVAAGRIDILAAGGSTSGLPGISRFEAGLGPIGETRAFGAGADWFEGGAGRDQIAGGAGDDTLSGGGGDDVLIDGAGSDLLRGGAGADVFVLLRDDSDDRIADFDPGSDRIDLSDFNARGLGAVLDFQPTDSGGGINLGSEQLWIDTVQGVPLEAGALQLEDVTGLWHLPVAAPVLPPPPPDPPRVLTGSAGADRLIGGSGNDRLTGEPGDAQFDTVSGQVFRLYRATLGRDPDLEGLRGWCDRLISGEDDLTGVAGRFTASAEFVQSYGALDTGGFVTLLYANVLGRSPDPTGFAGWTAVLDSGERSRAEVVRGFSESREFVDKTALDAGYYSHAGLQVDFSDEVFRLYRATLDRVPDPGGFRNWTAALAEGREYSDAIAGFTGSAEFRQTYGETDDLGFVVLLYANVLDRSPDPAGQAHWLARLSDEGWSREQVVEAFAGSREFVAKTTPELFDWARARPDDQLEAGGGSDLLRGGILSDSFIFSAADGGDHTIADYEPWDRLVLRDFGYDTPQEALLHMAQMAEDVVFEDQGLRITLQDTTRDEIVF